MNEDSDGSKALLGIVAIAAIFVMIGAFIIAMKMLNPASEMKAGGYSSDSLLHYFQSNMPPERAFKTFLAKT